MVEVSVVVPTYNRADVLPRAIDSVLNQTYSDFELIIVDDGSTDNTRELIYGYKDSRIKYIPLEENRGVSVARNIGVESACGDYVLFVDSDDELLENAIEVLVEKLKNEPSKCVGAHPSRKRVKHDSIIVFRPKKGRIDYGDVVNRNILGGIGGCIFRKEVFGYLYFDEKIKYGEDVDFYLRLLSKNGFYIVGIGSVLYIYYKHHDIKIEKPNITIESQKRLLEKHREDLPRRYKARIQLIIGLAKFSKGKMFNSLRYFLKGILFFPEEYLVKSPIYIFRLFRKTLIE